MSVQAYRPTDNFRLTCQQLPHYLNTMHLISKKYLKLFCLNAVDQLFFPKFCSLSR